MAKLPFVVQPKAKPVTVEIGNEDIGVFEIERRGYLTVAEKSFVDSFVSGSGGMRNLINLSNKIAYKKRLKKETSYIHVMNVLSGKFDSKLDKEIAEEYSQEIADISSEMIEMQNKRGIACATVLLQSRVDPEWTISDTFGIDPELIVQLVELYDKEEAKLKPDEEEGSPEAVAAEIVGK